MLQNWLRRTARIYRGWDNYATNFKQCCGLTTDLVVDYLIYLSGAYLFSNHFNLKNNFSNFYLTYCFGWLESGLFKETKAANLMFYQLLLVLTECVAQTVESVSRLGCACIR